MYHVKKEVNRLFNLSIPDYDELLFICESSKIDESISIIQQRKENKRIMIAGGEKITKHLAEKIKSDFQVKLIEADNDGTAIVSSDRTSANYAKTGDSDLALHHYTDALSTMGEAGDPLALVEVSILLGEVLQDSGRIEEALERYREALIISEANDLRMQIGELLARLGGVAPDRQRRMEYLQRALSVFRELGAQTRMREVQMMVHTAVMGR